jgi:hypothetical protein
VSQAGERRTQSSCYHRLGVRGFGAALVAVIVSACGSVFDRVPAGDEGTTGRGPEAETGTTGGTQAGATGGTYEGTLDEDGGMTFVMPPADLPGDACEIWLQDCERGEKCTPRWLDPGYVCTPVHPDPVGYGELCTRQDRSSPHFDDCDESTICILGSCAGFCDATHAVPSCPEPCSHLQATSSSCFCIPACDPIEQDCPSGRGCHGFGTGFVCVVDASGDGGSFGDPCSGLDECVPGHTCLPSALVPGCVTEACCSPFCDLTVPEACPATTQCIPWFERGSSPMEPCSNPERVGYCGAPP